MICGPCATQRHEQCNGLLRASYGFCSCADQNHEAIARRTEPASQPCEFCDRTAWHLSGEDRTDGTRVFACAAGHVAIVTVERVA